MYHKVIHVSLSNKYLNIQDFFFNFEMLPKLVLFI